MVPVVARCGSGAGKFRRELLGSAVCNTPEAHRLAGLVALCGGWTVQIAVHAAVRAGEDWQAAAAAEVRRLAEERVRRAGGVLRVGAVGAGLGWDWVGGGVA